MSPADAWDLTPVEFWALIDQRTEEKTPPTTPAATLAEVEQLELRLAQNG